MTEKPRARRSPAWTRDEILIVVEAVALNDWVQLREGDPRTAELSAFLRSVKVHPESSRTSDFRGEGAVSRKAGDIVSSQSSYSGTRSKGGQETFAVVRELESDLDRLRHEAQVAREVMRGLS